MRVHALALALATTACHAPSADEPGADASATADAAACAAWLAAQDPVLGPLAPMNQAKRDAMLVAGGGLFAVDDTYAGAWFPPAYFDGRPRRVVVVLHGTTGAPEYEWFDWHDALAGRGWGFVGLSYYYADRAPPADYSDGATVLARLQRALAAIDPGCGVADATVSLMGFSRGSALSFEVLARDRAGDGLLHGVIANAGAWPPGARPTPYLADIEARGDTDALAGGAMWMYCGTEDDTLGVPMCDAMTSARQWVERHGGTVAALYVNPGAEHHSMYATPAAVTEAFEFLAGH